MRETTNNLGLGNLWPGRDSIRAPPERKSEALPLSLLFGAQLTLYFSCYEHRHQIPFIVWARL
jgi:hypothetical protein